MTAPDDAAWIAAAGAPRSAPFTPRPGSPMPPRPGSPGPFGARPGNPGAAPVRTPAVQAPAPQPQAPQAPEPQPPALESEAPESESAQPESPRTAEDDATAAAVQAVIGVETVQPDSQVPARDESTAPADPAATDEAAPAEVPDTAVPQLFLTPAEPVLGPTGRPYRIIPEPAVIETHGPARVIAMCNQKGGVGKTTSTINLGAALALFGRRVLLVDLDPQGALSAGLGVQSHQLDRTIYNLMLERSTTIADVLVPTKIDGMDLLPANIDLSAAEVQLISEVGREQTLARALRPVLHAYDYVLIDCQPSLGLLTVNALACAHSVVMPVAAEYFALRGVALLVDTINKVQERLNPDLTVDGVLVTMFDGRTVHSREVVATLVEQFGDQLYDSVISRTVKFPEATVAGDPIATYAPNSAAAAAYRNLAKEVIAHDARR